MTTPADHRAPVNAPLAERMLSPLQQFTKTSSAGGIVLLTATVIALGWANSPWRGAYHQLWDSTIGVTLGEYAFRLSLHHLINDGLMAVFFFLVGLEIKREVVAGELASLRSASLPMAAALGGVVVPALLYVALNPSGPDAAGWGVPMATDIAFALGVLALLGDRVPLGLKVFLTALAIVDDIVAVLVIAVFYSGGIAVLPLVAAALLLGLAIAANAAGVRRPWIYGGLGLALWSAVSMSGIHATVAGVLLALTIPVRTRIDEAAFLEGARRALNDFADAAGPDVPRGTILSDPDRQAALAELEILTDRAQAPLLRIEHSLHGIVAFGIMPLFALANAGVALSAEAIRGASTAPITLGVLIGLVIGKPLGILAFSWVAVRMGFAALPGGVDWRMIAGAGMLAGIGFTMALFVAGLAFTAPEALDVAKMGVLAASVIAGFGGALLLRRVLPGATRD